MFRNEFVDYPTIVFLETGALEIPSMVKPSIIATQNPVASQIGHTLTLKT